MNFAANNNATVDVDQNGGGNVLQETGLGFQADTAYSVFVTGRVGDGVIPLRLVIAQDSP